MSTPTEFPAVDLRREKVKAPATEAAAWLENPTAEETRSPAARLIDQWETEPPWTGESEEPEA